MFSNFCKSKEYLFSFAFSLRKNFSNITLSYKSFEFPKDLSIFCIRQMLGNLVKIRQYLWNWLTFRGSGELVVLKTLKVNKVAKKQHIVLNILNVLFVNCVKSYSTSILAESERNGTQRVVLQVLGVFVYCYSFNGSCKKGEN